MNSVTSGSFVGAGSFQCSACGYVLTLEGSESLTGCPSCGGRDFVRASMFNSTERISGQAQELEGTLVKPEVPDHAAHLAEVRPALEPGEYLAYEENGELRTVPLAREWTRIGRSLAADLRFDDPTVSRRHALVVRHADGVRLLDDRSLNGVFVNGSRVDGQLLVDGDEIIVGRYRLTFLAIPAPAEGS